MAGALVPTNYNATTSTAKKNEAIHIVLSNGTVKEYGIEPLPPVDGDRIPLTDAHRRGVYDPMTGSMLRVPGTSDPLTPEACRTSTGIFDGRMRYDLNLDFKRIETVKAEHGYHGPAVVCAIYFTPVAGYIPDRPVIRYLAAQRDIEIAFVPVAGTRILVPFWMKIPTPLGPALLEATISSRPPPRRASRRRIDGGAASFPSPLVGEGGAKRRMRGFSPRVRCSRREPLTRHERAPRVPATLSHRGEGSGRPTFGLTLRRF